VVKVTALSALLPIPTFTPPPSNHPLPLGEEVEEETPLEFGGTNNGHTGGEVGTLVAGGQAAAQGETGWTSAGASFSSGNQSAHMPSAASNILWGAAAAAVLGMTLADWQRKREEEAAARLAAERANEVPDDVLARRRAKVMAKNQAQRAQESRWEAARVAQNAKPEIDEDTFMQKTYKKILSTANVIPGVSAWKKQEDTKVKEQVYQNAVSATRWAGVASVAQGRRESQYDLTSWMPLVINRNLQSPELAEMRFYNNFIGGTGPWLLELLGDFRSLNTGGGRWDIKLEMQDEFRNGLGDKDSAHILCSNSGTCRWVDYSTAGNVLYGVTAADAGVPRWMSKLAGGLLEAWEGTAKAENLSNWLEDPYDTNAVNFGYDLYESTGGNITEEAFRNALTYEVLNSLQPPPEGFVLPFEAQPQPNTYQVDRFDHQPEE
jgi:hypothetical protein